MNFVRGQSVERKASDNVKVEQIAGKWDDLPSSVRNYEPDSFYARLVYDLGNHIENLRLPGGYHVTVDIESGPVNLHYDAHDPLTGPWQNYLHWYDEVRRLNNGSLRELPPVNNYPDWQPGN